MLRRHTAWAARRICSGVPPDATKSSMMPRVAPINHKPDRAMQPIVRTGEALPTIEGSQLR